MGVTAAIVGGLGAAYVYKESKKAPAVPQITPPPVTDPAKMAEAGELAGQRQRRRGAGATGRSDTILTGPQGLGSVAPGQASVKTLLGM